MLPRRFPKTLAALAKACRRSALARFSRLSPWRRARPRCRRGLPRRMPANTDRKYPPLGADFSQAAEVQTIFEAAARLKRVG